MTGPISLQLSALIRSITRILGLAFIMTVIWGAWFATQTRAQLRSVAEPVSLPGMSMAAPDSAWAVDLNPAALAFAPSWSLAYQHSEATSGERLTGRGDGFALAIPVWQGTALGFSAHSIRPSLAEKTARYAPAFGHASVALAHAFSPNVSVGSALRFINAADRELDGITTVDLAFNWRPAPFFASTLMARDLTSPNYRVSRDSVPRSFVAALALRPLMSDWLTFEGAGGLDADERVMVRGSASARLPNLFRVMAAYEWRKDHALRDHLATVGVAFDWGHLSMNAGLHSGPGNNGVSPWYVGAELSGTTREGVPTGRVALEVRIENDGSAQAWLKKLTAIEAALYDDRVGALVLKPEATMRWAHAQELRELVQRFKAAKKPVLCMLESASGQALYACTPAARVVLDPAGRIDLKGMSNTILLFGHMLEQVGVRGDFVRIGKYKSAPEQWTRGSLTAPAREQGELFVEDLYQRVVSDFARDWQQSPQHVQATIDAGPFTAKGAIGRHLIDALAADDHVDAELTKLQSSSMPLVDALSSRYPHHWGVAPRIGVVVVDGTIVDGDSVDVPFVGVHMSGSRTVVQAVERLANDHTVRAIIVRIDSPGGSALASEKIWRALHAARKAKPVIASIGAMAASGGYYIASAASEIWAAPSALTGSIGIFFGKLDMSGLAKRLGIGVEYFERGRFAGAESVWRPLTPAEREVAQAQIQEGYELFLQRVAQGRKMSTRRVHAIAQGHVWSADRAKALGLIDHLGGFTTALARLRARLGLHHDARLWVLPKTPETLSDYVFGTSERASLETMTGASFTNAIRPLIEMAGAFDRSGSGLLAMDPEPTLLQ